MTIPKDSIRIKFASSLKRDLYKKLKDYSELTDIPISKVLDRAVGQFFDEIKNKHQQGKSSTD